MTESPEDYELFHYGVKGMKWGVRRRSGGGSSGPRQPGRIRRAINDYDNAVKDARSRDTDLARTSVKADVNAAKAGVDIVRRSSKGKRLEKLDDFNRAMDERSSAAKAYKDNHAVASLKTSKEIVGSLAFTVGLAAIPSMSSAMANTKANSINRSTAKKRAEDLINKTYNDRADNRGLPSPNTIVGEVIDR